MFYPLHIIYDINIFVNHLNIEKNIYIIIEILLKFYR